jgi:isopenicillin-N N-acyltransferase like protein
MHFDNQNLLDANPKHSPHSELSNGSLATTPNHNQHPIPDRLGGLPLAQLTGSPHEIGLRHGKLFASEIRSCLTAYHTVWNGLTASERSAFIDQQQKIIEENFPQYADEIHAIAQGADLPVRDIFSLNGRTEITLYQHQLQALRSQHSEQLPLECTLLGSTETKVMGENWDWAQCIEKITTLLHITREHDGHRILTLSEPGIIGKVGMNSAGLAVGLNFIPGTAYNAGVPVHILLRSCLDSSSFAEVEERLIKLQEDKLLGTMSAITVMDKQGNAEVFEILGSELIPTKDKSRSSFEHTNHPVLNPSGYGTEDLENTLARLSDAKELVGQLPLTTERLKSILADRSNSAHMINMQPQAWGAIGLVETIRSLVFDLENGTFHISCGSPGSSSNALAYEQFKIY